MNTIVMVDSNREVFKALLESRLNMPYIYGSNPKSMSLYVIPKNITVPKNWDNDGVDCSGLVMDILQSMDYIPLSDDYTAESLFDGWDKHLKFGRKWSVPQGDAEAARNCYSRIRSTVSSLGWLLFYNWKGKKKISHVALAYNSEWLVEAGGGGSSCITRKQAYAIGAGVRFKPLTHRIKDLRGIASLEAVTGKVY